MALALLVAPVIAEEEVALLAIVELLEATEGWVGRWADAMAAALWQRRVSKSWGEHWDFNCAYKPCCEQTLKTRMQD